MKKSWQLSFTWGYPISLRKYLSQETVKRAKLKFGISRPDCLQLRQLKHCFGVFSSVFPRKKADSEVLHGVIQISLRKYLSQETIKRGISSLEWVDQIVYNWGNSSKNKGFLVKSFQDKSWTSKVLNRVTRYPLENIWVKKQNNLSLDAREARCKIVSDKKFSDKL